MNHDNHDSPAIVRATLREARDLIGPIKPGNLSSANNAELFRIHEAIIALTNAIKD